MKSTLRITKKMLRPLFIILLVAASLAGCAALTEKVANVQSLRGIDVPTLDAETVLPKTITNREPVKRNYDQQPPLIPHDVADHKITKTSNECLFCHTWKDADENSPTKVSRTHFKDYSSTDDANLSSRRWFCVQCHVSQTDAKPLVGNSYKPANPSNQ